MAGRHTDAMKKLSMLALLLVGCSLPQDGETTYSGIEILSPAAIKVAKAQPDFQAHVKPILEGRCVMCHNKRTLPGFMSLENRQLAFKPGATGIPIVSGHPEKSLLVANVSHSHANVKVMPPVGERVTRDEIAILRTWIAQGAAWPAGKAGRLDPEAQMKR